MALDTAVRRRRVVLRVIPGRRYLRIGERKAGGDRVDGDVVDLETLKAADLIKDDVKRVRVFLSGDISRAVNVRGLTVTKGAKAAIEAAGGSVEA